MSFSINPCLAAVKKFGDCDLNEINNKCYETCAAFAEVVNNTDISEQCRKNCETCVKQSVSAMGRNPCQLRPGVPPIFSQVPHYFPQLLYETKDPVKAFTQCKIKCRTNNMNQYECIDNCKFDASSLVPGCVEKYQYNTYHHHSFGWYILYFLAFLIVAIPLFFLLKTISKSLVK